MTDLNNAQSDQSAFDNIVGVEPIPGPDVDPLEQLAHLVPALWRTMKRAAKSSEKLPVNESHVGILRMLIQYGELPPARLADLLNLARPTVSNLLKTLVSDGLVDRRIDPHDSRAFILNVTDSGRRVLEDFRADRVSVLREASENMSLSEREQLRASIPTLRHLLRELEFVASDKEAE